MEQNKEMTAQESLNLISETLNTSRRDILKDSARYIVLWGLLLVVFSLVIYELWHVTGKPVLNWLWFAMPFVGYPLASLLGKKGPASFAECLTGIMLRNWPTIVAGFVLGVGGALAAAVLRGEGQLLLFTLGGAVMVITGIIVKHQYK